MTTQNEKSAFAAQNPDCKIVNANGVEIAICGEWFDNEGNGWSLEFSFFTPNQKDELWYKKAWLSSLEDIQDIFCTLGISGNTRVAAKEAFEYITEYSKKTPKCSARDSYYGV